MPVDKVTAAQFQDLIRSGISSRNATHDTAFGPIRDIVIDPVAAVLEQQNDRVRMVSLLLSLLNSTEFSEGDLNGVVFNESMLRLPGESSSATLVFTADLLPSADLIVQRGFPVATRPDESTGQSVTFVTTEETTMVAADAALGRYAVLQADGTTSYELHVPAVAVVAGTVGRVGARRINRPLRPLVGFQKVENQTSAVGGLDPETNVELIERFLLAIVGRQLSVKNGVERFVLDNAAGVSDTHVIHGDNALLARAGSDAGAVDAFIIGSNALSRTDNLTFLGVGQTMTVTLPPLLSVSSVTRAAPPATYVEDTDWETVLDTTGLSGSTRGVDGIRLSRSFAAPSP